MKKVDPCPSGQPGQGNDSQPKQNFFACGITAHASGFAPFYFPKQKDQADPAEENVQEKSVINLEKFAVGDAPGGAGVRQKAEGRKAIVHQKGSSHQNGQKTPKIIQRQVLISSTAAVV
ncbi:MAG: hypothetical protein WAO07_14690 [Desulfobacterales bacterium]